MDARASTYVHRVVAPERPDPGIRGLEPVLTRRTFRYPRKRVGSLPARLRSDIGRIAAVQLTSHAIDHSIGFDMIKSISLLSRRPELTHDEFVRHWVDVHAPLAHAVPRVKRYVQSHILGERTRPDIETLDLDIDGIAELWYDSIDDLHYAMSTPEAKRLHDDGATFIGRIKTYTIDERIVLPRNDA